MDKDLNKKAIRVIFIFGIVSLLGDITYEGARSITGPYLAMLGASATVIGIVAGAGELLGYGLRFLSGYIADKSKQYWLMTIIGYLTIAAIPLLAFAEQWELAAFLLIIERVGKAIRSPARDTILSHITKQVGRGVGFGIHEFLDQIGAFFGPLIFSAAFILKMGYQQSFLLFFIPVILLILFLIYARIRVPTTEEFEIKSTKPADFDKPNAVFWAYNAFMFLAVAGLATFPLIAFHLKANSIADDYVIPLLYTLAMGVDAFAALFIGLFYDKKGFKTLLAIPLLTIPLPFLCFSNDLLLVFIGVGGWGMIMGMHETIIRAAIADLTGINKRAWSYGIFNILYGISWFFGSSAMGILYNYGIEFIIGFVLLLEILSLIAFNILYSELRKL